MTVLLKVLYISESKNATQIIDRNTVNENQIFNLLAQSEDRWHRSPQSVYQQKLPASSISRTATKDNMSTHRLHFFV